MSCEDNNQKQGMSRRGFLATTVAGSVGLATGAKAASDSGSGSVSNPICVFVKPLRHLSFEAMAERVASLGVAGIEAPIRDWASLFPVEEVPDKLPALMKALRQRNLSITVWASDIHEVTPVAEKALRTAAKLGVKRYRLDGLHYDFGRPLLKQLDEHRARLRDLATLNKELGMQAVYQVHAGRDRVGAGVWDLLRLFGEIPPDQLSCAFDIRHATVGGGQCWPQHFHLMQEERRLGIVYVKDAVWVDRGRQQEVKNVPLGEGMVQMEFFEMLKASGYDGPISLHEEYLAHDDPALVPKHLEAMRRDLATLQKALRG